MSPHAESGGRYDEGDPPDDWRPYDKGGPIPAGYVIAEPDWNELLLSLTDPPYNGSGGADA